MGRDFPYPSEEKAAVNSNVETQLSRRFLVIIFMLT